MSHRNEIRISTSNAQFHTVPFVSIILDCKSSGRNKSRNITLSNRENWKIQIVRQKCRACFVHEWLVQTTERDKRTSFVWDAFAGELNMVVKTRFKMQYSRRSNPIGRFTFFVLFFFFFLNCRLRRILSEIFHSSQFINKNHGLACHFSR